MRRGVSRPFLLVVLLLGILGVLGAPAAAQAPEGAILLIMDSSGSMDATDADGVPLIDGAKDALRGVVDSLPDGTHVGLRVYGHREPNTDEERGCRDTELISPVQALDRDALHEAIDGFEPSGFTPIGASLQAAADDLPPEGPRTIILVSDGEDTCAPPDPCEVAADLRGDGVDLVVETVGFALGSDEAARKQLECIAEAGGGQFTDVATAAELVEELEAVSTREARRFEADGTPVEGGPIPAEAPLLEPGASYVDSILEGEQLYYAVDVTPGAVLDVQVIRGVPEGAAELAWRNVSLAVVDRDDDPLGSTRDNEYYRVPATLAVRDVEVPEDLDRLLVRVTVDPTRSDDGPHELPLQLQVDLAGGAEPEPEVTEEPEEVEEPEDDPDDEDVGLASEPAESGGLPAWAAVLLTLLVVLVLGLGALVVVLFRRTSASAGSSAAGSPPPPPPA